MKKFILIYSGILLLLCLSFYSFKKVYGEWIDYSERGTRANTALTLFRDLSAHINNAAVINPDFLEKENATEGFGLFYADSASILKTLHELRAAAQDSINTTLVARLDSALLPELSWIIKSNVPDSIVHHKAEAHVSTLEHIHLLTLRGKERTEFLLLQNQVRSDHAFKSLVTWIVVFIILSFSMLVFTSINLFRQRSKRKEKENELMNKETQFHYILDNMLEGIQIHDFNWKYIYVNDELAAYSKSSREDLLGKTLMEKYPGIEQTDLFKTFDRCMKERVSHQMETEFFFPDGRKADYELRIQPVPEGIFILSIDITKRKKAEKKLHKVNRLYQFISNINKSIVHVTDKKKLLNSVCKIATDIGQFKLAYIALLDENNILKLTSLSGDEAIANGILSQSGMDCNNPDFKDFPSVKAIKLGKYHFNNDIQNDLSLYAKQEIFITHGIQASIAFPIFKFGKPIGVFGLHSIIKDFFNKEEIALLDEAAGDISFALENFEKTETHKKTEELLLKNEKRFRGLIEKSSDMKTLTSKEGKLTYVSPSVINSFGFSMEELIGQDALQFFHPDDIPELAKNKYEILEKPGAFYSFSIRLLHKNNSWVWCEGTVTNLLHDPAVQGMVSNFMDITERKKDEELLAKNSIERELFIKELTQNNKDLQQFAYITSHNLRGPIASLLGLTNLLEDFKVNDPMLLQILSGIKKASYNFDETIKDLNTILSVKDSINIKSEPLLFLKGFTKAIEQCEGLLKESNAKLEYDFDPSPEVHFNKAYLESIFLNLLTNALKYRDKARRLTINVRTETIDDTIVLTFSDNGLGIDLTMHREKTFKLYQQFHNKTEGKGLGLFLVKSQLEALGGSISLESEVNSGTTFIIKFSKN